MIRGYVAIVDGDSPSADIHPDSTSCKKTAVKLATSDKFEFYITIKGTDYSFTVTGNVRTVDKCNIASGILRLGFNVPNLDIVVSGTPKELEAFVYTLVAVKDLRALPPICSDRTHWRKLKCSDKRPQHANYSCYNRMCSVGLENLCEFCCFSVLQGYSRDDAHKILNTWKSCTCAIADPGFTKYNKEEFIRWANAPIVSKCLCDFDFDSVITDPVERLNSITVNSYTYLKRITARYGDLVEIPEALGALPCLTALDLSSNRLGQATDWNWLTSPFLRENLCELNMNSNKLHSIPETILGLRNLKYLSLNGNYLTELPNASGNLKFLRELHLAVNKLVILPGWMYRKERFFALHTLGNELERAKPCMYAAKPQLQRHAFETVTVPSLSKTVATYIIANSLAFCEYNIPTMLMEYLEAAYICRCDSVVFPDSTGPVVQCWINAEVLAESYDMFRRGFPIAIRCCSYECYKLIERSRVFH